MPFIGLDWRSPGEHWSRTPAGSWERTKTMENSPPQPSFLLDHAGLFLGKMDDSGSGDNSVGLMEEREDRKENQMESGCSVSEIDKLDTAPAEVAEHMTECMKLDTGVNCGSPKSSFGLVESPRRSLSPVEYQPHCHIAKRSTRESTAYITLSEAFWKLDFCGAVRDMRRFSYVCKVLDLLISEKLSSLGGQAQKLLFSTLEHVVGQVVSSQQNAHIMRQLMRDLNMALEESNMTWGRHVGSSRLWEQHRQRLTHWNTIVDSFVVQQFGANGESLGRRQSGSIRNQVKRRTEVSFEAFERVIRASTTSSTVADLALTREREEDDKAMLTDLPEECMRLILLCLSDHHDLVRSAEALKATSHGMIRFGHIFDEQRLWRELCFFHFDSAQLKRICNHQGRQNKNKESDLETSTSDADTKDDWELIYRRMKRLFGLKETFAETLHLCLHCRTLFWEPYGHPCPVVPILVDTSNSSNESSPRRRSSHLNVKAVVPISPRAFLDFFSL